MHASTVDRRPLYPDGAVDASGRTTATISAPDAAGWRQRAACRNADPELFFPTQGKSNRPAKRICAGCPVRPECLEWVLTAQPTCDQDFGIYAGMTPEERRKLRAARAKSNRQPRRQPTTANGASPAPGEQAAKSGGGTRFPDRTAAQQAWQLAERVGINEAAQRLGVGTGSLYRAWRRWGLGVPDTTAAARRQTAKPGPAPRLRDRAAAQQAWQLAERVGINEAARQLRVGTGSLYRAWRRWDLGVPDTSASVARWQRQVDAQRGRAFRRAERLRVASLCGRKLPGHLHSVPSDPRQSLPVAQAPAAEDREGAVWPQAHLSGVPSAASAV